MKLFCSKASFSCNTFVSFCFTASGVLTSWAMQRAAFWMLFCRCCISLVATARVERRYWFWFRLNWASRYRVEKKVISAIGRMTNRKMVKISRTVRS